jgi:GNAT superfamily N-acetyltransferase
MTAFAIRTGTVRDRDYIADLGRRVAWTSVSSQRIAPLPLVEAAYEQFVEYVIGRDHDVLIAEADGRPAGFALLLYDLPDEVTLTEQAFLAYMAVEPDRWRQGVGRALLEHVEAAARRRGLPYLSLMVTEDNAGARELYAGAGFTTERRMMTKTL